MLHPFMGIKDYGKVGMSVAESSHKLHRIGYVDRRLMKLEAGHMVARPEYEVKGALSRLMWQDASHCDQLRSRCKQLRMSSSAFDKSPDPNLELLMDEVLKSADTLQLMRALFEVVKPDQIRSARAYMASAQPIVDEPTIHLLKHQLMDREEQLEWGNEAVRHFTADATEKMVADADRWVEYLRNLLAAAGGIDGDLAKEEPDPELAVAAQLFELPASSTRDERFRSAVSKFKEFQFEDSEAGRFEMMMFTRFFEMSPAEAVACVHFQSEGKPWEFYLDTARHAWDEVRHSWFGEAALRVKGYDIYDKPNWTGWLDMTLQLFEPDEAYTHLTIAIEKAAMKYPPGKREEWEFCRDIARDPLMTTFQDFDWADEVVHAGFGQRWIVNDVHKGDLKQAMTSSAETVEKRGAYMAKFDHQGAEPKSPYAGGY